MRGSTRLNSQRYTSWFIYPAGEDNYSWVSSGEGVADSVELVGGFLGALQYLPYLFLHRVAGDPDLFAGSGHSSTGSGSCLGVVKFFQKVHSLNFYKKYLTKF